VVGAAAAPEHPLKESVMSLVVPDACTLPTAERPLRLAEFDDLFATAVRRVETAGPTRARMWLSGPPGLEATVRDLAARESECCSFFTFTTTAAPAGDGTTLTLDVEVPPPYADVLDSLVQRARTTRLVAGAERLGIGGDDLAGLAAAWHAGECPEAHRRLADAVAARLTDVQDTLIGHQLRATTHGPGTPGWVEETRAGVPLAEEAARLQAVAAALADAPQAGPCGDGCGCATALAASGTTYHFPAGDSADATPLACDLAADGGDAVNRIGSWQQVFTRVERRDPLPDTATGLALRFPLDVDLAATLARLAAAEYRCCSFGSYTVVVDDTGLRLEVRMPDDAAGVLASVLGVPDAAPAS
jgi:hypothetical protein